MSTKVLSVGGSIVAPEYPDTDFVKKFVGMVKKFLECFGQVDSLSANPSWISECDACQTIMCQFLSLSAQYYTVDNSSKIALSQMSQSQCLCIRNVNNLHWVSNDTRAIILLFVRQTQMLHQITHLLEGILLDALRLLRVADFHK